MRGKSLLSVVIILFFVFSCASDEKKLTAVSEFERVFKILKSEDYLTAAEEFEKISDDFAFSSLASRAKTMAVYSFYMSQEYQEVIRSGDDFLSLYPSHKYSDYILYIQALSYFDQIPQVDRAQDNSRLSSSILRELVARYPNSKYYPDSKRKISRIDEFLAASFISKARYFMNSEKYVAAIKNLQQVIARYSHTKQYCEANFRLVEIFYKLGIDSQIYNFAENLKNKCQDSRWFKKSEKIILAI